MPAMPPVPPNPQSLVRAAGSSAQDPAWTRQHKHDEEREGENVGHLGRSVVSADGNDLAHDEGGDEAADHVAEAAENANHESKRSEGVADERVHVILQG